MKKFIRFNTDDDFLKRTPMGKCFTSCDEKNKCVYEFCKKHEDDDTDWKARSLYVTRGYRDGDNVDEINVMQIVGNVVGVTEVGVEFDVTNPDFNDLVNSGNVFIAPRILWDTVNCAIYSIICFDIYTKI